MYRSSRQSIRITSTKLGHLRPRKNVTPPRGTSFIICSFLLFSSLPLFSFFFLLPRVRGPPGCSPAVLYDVVKNHPRPAHSSVRSSVCPPYPRPGPICRVRAYGGWEISRFAYTSHEFTRRRQRRASFDDRLLRLARLTRFCMYTPSYRRHFISIG